MTCVVFVCSPNFDWTNRERVGPYGGDALQEWVGSYVTRTAPTRLYDPSYTIPLQHDAELVGYSFVIDRHLPMVYPPFYYVALRPLSYLTTRQAANLFLIAMAACVGLAFHLMQRHAGRLRRRPRWTSARSHSAPEFVQVQLRYAGENAGLLCLAVLFGPLLESLNSGQKSALVLLLFTASYCLLNANRRFVAGAVAGLLAFKPQLVLVYVAVMLWRREWRVLGGMVVCGLALLTLNLPAGLAACRDYVQFAAGASEYMTVSGYELTRSHSLYGFFALLMPGTTTALVKAATLVSLGIVAVLIAMITHRREERISWPIMFSAIVLATPLVSPHLYTYDLTMLVLPMFLLWQVARSEQRYRSLVWVAMGLFLIGTVSAGIAKVTNVQLTVVVMVASLFWLERVAVPRKFTAFALPGRNQPIIGRQPRSLPKF